MAEAPHLLDRVLAMGAADREAWVRAWRDRKPVACAAGVTIEVLPDDAGFRVRRSDGEHVGCFADLGVALEAGAAASAAR